VMPQYNLYVRCKECGALHPMRIGIYLDEGPIEKQSIGDAFQGKSLPPQVLAIAGHKTLCLRTGKMFAAENKDQIFLVPIAL
jgi:hypothetical protein